MYKILSLVAFSVILTLADPTPTGGANCTDDSDCNGSNGGECSGNNTCICPNTLADVDCSYQRYSADLAGGLNIGLPFIGICGIGNFVIKNNGHAIGQLILGLSNWMILLPMCCGAIALGLSGKSKEFIFVGGPLACVAFLGGLAGFIWSIVEGALMIQGDITDGNGYSLYY